MPKPIVDFPVFDADNHMYETTDAFTKFLPPAYSGLIKYVEVNGRTKIAVRNVISEYIPNPTFNVVGRPGASEEPFKHGNPEGKSRREIIGDPIRSPEAFFSPAGEKNASGDRIGSPMISRRLFPSGLPCLKSSSEAPGRPTTLNVGFGMYSEITLRTAIFVRPLTSTYLISPEYAGGRNFVKASVVSYMWLSASKTGKSIMGFGMATSVERDRCAAASTRRPCSASFSTSTSILHE